MTSNVNSEMQKLTSGKSGKTYRNHELKNTNHGRSMYSKVIMGTKKYNTLGKKNFTITRQTDKGIVKYEYGGLKRKPTSRQTETRLTDA